MFNLRNGLVGAFILFPLFVSCGKNEKNITYNGEKSTRLEKITCNSDGSYTECSVLNTAVRIVSVDARRAEDCLQGVDYYLLNDKVLVSRNGCEANFTLEVE